MTNAIGNTETMDNTVETLERQLREINNQNGLLQQQIDQREEELRRIRSQLVKSEHEAKRLSQVF